MGTTRCDGLCRLVECEPVARYLDAVRPALQVAGIEVNGQYVEISVDDEEVCCVYAPLAALALSAGLRSGRALVAIAGPPGSGKSVFAQLLAGAVAALDPDRRVEPVCVGLDGFHVPNDTLASRTTAVHGEGDVPLTLYKGAEFTYDVEAAKAKLDEIKGSPDSPVAMPVYDRRVHEPVADGAKILAACRLVLMEGNYLLLDEGDWQGVAERFGLTMYLDMCADDCKPGLIARHVRGGRSEADAEQHYRRVDLRNARVIEGTRGRADLVVAKTSGHRCTDVHVQNLERIGRFL